MFYDDIMLVGGFNPSEVSWDYEIPNIWNNKIHVPNHQPAWECSGIYTSIYPYLSNEISTIVMGF